MSDNTAVWQGSPASMLFVCNESLGPRRWALQAGPNRIHAWASKGRDNATRLIPCGNVPEQGMCMPVFDRDPCANKPCAVLGATCQQVQDPAKNND
jgi:hypothetical protein